jgi:hypothetical protein
MTSAALVYQCTFLVFTVQNVKTALTLPTRQTIMIFGVNGLLLVAGFYVALYYRYARRERQPAYNALVAMLKKHGTELFEWVACIKENERVILACSSPHTQEMLPVHLLEDRMYDTRAHTLKATSRKVSGAAAARSERGGAAAANMRQSARFLLARRRGGAAAANMRQPSHVPASSWLAREALARLRICLVMYGSKILMYWLQPLHVPASPWLQPSHLRSPLARSPSSRSS